MRFAATLGLVAVIAATACGAPDARVTSGPCKGAQLKTSFTAMRGSEGAGNIVYTLRITNTSSSVCTVSGLPNVQLLSKTGKKLPTHVVAANPKALTAVLVRLAHGASAKATARFSPDVPGVGEGNRMPCEPVASFIRVLAPGGGSSRGPIRPATSVCEHGQLQFSAY